MPNPSQPSFDHEATLEELAGVGKNRRFDEVIDDDEFEDIQVICKRGEEEIPLAKPSRAFYFGDRNLYDQEAKRFDQAEKSRILNTDQFRRNLEVFDELKRCCQRGFVIPFVGAGMSKSAGLPEWKEYLLGQCHDAGLAPEAIRERLEVQSDYEGVMNDIVQRLTLHRFERDFERSFQLPDEIGGAVTLLPKLFDSSVITTNFDRVLERVYENEAKVFEEKVTGRGRANAFFRAIPAGQRYLLKLHGNIDNAAERVLNANEYAEAYGNEGDINMTFPLPKLLERGCLRVTALCSSGAVFQWIAPSKPSCASQAKRVMTACRTTTQCYPAPVMPKRSEASTSTLPAPISRHCGTQKASMTTLNGF